MRQLRKVIGIVLVALFALAVVVASVVAYQACAMLSSEWYPEDEIVGGPPDLLLDSIQVGDKTVQFYVDYSRDFATLGYFVKDAAGRPRYFPLEGSTYRGLARMTVNVFLSDTREEMWTQIDRREGCRYFRADNDFITAHGYDATWPEKFDRGLSSPPLPSDAKEVLSFTVGKD